MILWSKNFDLLFIFFDIVLTLILGGTTVSDEASSVINISFQVIVGSILCLFAKSIFYKKRASCNEA